MNRVPWLLASLLAMLMGCSVATDEERLAAACREKGISVDDCRPGLWGR